MNINSEEAAALAKDTYQKDADRPVNSHHPVVIGGHSYTIIAAISNADTGYRARAYQRTDTGAVTIAECGTMSPLQDSGRDAVTDFLMVRDQTNRQWPEAQRFAEKAIAAAKATEPRFGHPIDITVTGHSLGGTLAELTAAKFHLRGTTFNAYGAVDLGYGVPEGGTQVTNYVMAGDVVSAGSRHYGQVVPLASDDDVRGLRAGRYLDAAPGTPPPNPYLTMSLADHSVTLFSPEPGSGKLSVLDPAVLARYEKNYADNKTAFDHYRHDVYEERAELAVALRHTDSRDLASTWENLSPRIQQQLAEWHASKVDAPIHSTVEHNAVIRGVEHGLDQAGATLRTAGHTIHDVDDRAASAMFHASTRMTPVLPTAPLAGLALAEGMHLHGEVAQATGHLATAVMQHAEQDVQLAAHMVAGAATMATHQAESVALMSANLGVRIGHGSEAALQHATHAYDAARRAVSRETDAVEHAAQHTGEALHAFAERTGAAYAENTLLRGQTISATADALMHRPPADAGNAAAAPNHHDPRHPDSSLHGLYNELHRRIPDAGEQRLLQFTAACHAHHISAHNLGAIHLDEANATMHFNGNDIWARSVSVNFSQPSPPPEQSMLHIQQHDQQQAQVMGQIHAQQGSQRGGPTY